MRLRWLLFGVLVLGLVGSGGMFGDDTKAPKGRAGLPPNWGKLGLSDEQKQQAYSIQGEYRTRIDALRRQIAELQRKERTELQKVLTEAQRNRLKDIATSKVVVDDEKKTESPGKK